MKHGSIHKKGYLTASPHGLPIRVWVITLRLILLLAIVCPVSLAAAQEDNPTGPIYIVQLGDTLWDIAQRFGVGMDELAAANDIADANQLKAGDHLVIPGLEGVQGILTTQIVPFGETLRSLSRQYGVPTSALATLNHITSPLEVYVGMSLVIPQIDTPNLNGQRTTLTMGQSLLELAVLNNTDTWALVGVNELSGSWAALPGDLLRAPGEGHPGPGALPASITAADISHLSQGKTGEIRISVQDAITLSGSLNGHMLNFFPDESGKFVALQGVHAMTPPGLYQLTLQGALADGTPFSFSQAVRVEAGEYLYDPPIQVDPANIDPKVTKPEDAQWTALAAPVTNDKLWDGLFITPVEAVFANCWPSVFGSRRSYNDSGYDYFHTGLDFCGSIGDDIYAPAPGIVVFAGPLSVRGNATMIDHGLGVYTAYMHQSEILVQPGERVETGQLIGRVGATGRVTGPHLHWEVWVGGVQVEPLDWLQQLFP